MLSSSDITHRTSSSRRSGRPKGKEIEIEGEVDMHDNGAGLGPYTPGDRGLQMQQSTSIVSWKSAFFCLLLAVVSLSLYSLESLTHAASFSTSTLSEPTDSLNSCETKYKTDPKSLVGAYGIPTSDQYSRPITCGKSEHLGTSSQADLQSLFDQGMLHLYGFNMPEARRNFNALLELDKQCAIAFWGLAYTYGPFLNSVLIDVDIITGRKAIDQAILLVNSAAVSSTISEIEKDLILALDKRFALSAHDWNANTQQHYDKVYQSAMRDLYHRYDTDADVAALYGVVGVDMTRWNYFSKGSEEDGRRSKAMILHTSLQESLAAVERSLELSRNRNPLALHIYIHIAEQSSEMAKSTGISAANALSALVGDRSANHLLHMPGHIYLRTGLYADCVKSGLKAIAMDDLYKQRCLSPYADLHDKAMLIAGALFQGDMHLALNHSFSVYNTLHYFAVYLSALFPTPKELILARFGHWDSIIDLQLAESQSASLKSSQSASTSVGSGVGSDDEDELNEGSRELLMMEVIDSVYRSGSSLTTQSTTSEAVMPKLSRRMLVALMENRPVFMKVMRKYSSTLALIGKNLHRLCGENGVNRWRCTSVSSDAMSNSRKMTLKVEKALSDLSRLVSMVTYDSVPDPSNPGRSPLPESHVFYPYHREVAELMNATAHASYLVALGDMLSAVPILTSAVALQESFSYMEPENFYLPMSECLGSVYLNLALQAKFAGEQNKNDNSNKIDQSTAGVNRFEEYAGLAIDTFLDDLYYRPWNGWSLRGLIDAKTLMLSTAGQDVKLTVGDRSAGAVDGLRVRRRLSRENDNSNSNSNSNSKLRSEINLINNSDSRHFSHLSPADLSIDDLKLVLAANWVDNYLPQSVGSRGEALIQGSCCELGFC